MGWANSGSLGRGRPFSAAPRQQEDIRPQLLSDVSARPVVFVARMVRPDAGAGNGSTRPAPPGIRRPVVPSTK